MEVCIEMPQFDMAKNVIISSNLIISIPHLNFCVSSTQRPTPYTFLYSTLSTLLLCTGCLHCKSVNLSFLSGNWRTWKDKSI